MNWLERIAADPTTRVSHQSIRETPMAGEFILCLLARSWKEEEITRNLRMRWLPTKNINLDL